MRRVLTNHALQRFRQRVDRKATLAQVQAELDAGEYRKHAPAGYDIARAYDQVGFVVTGRIVFPMIQAREPDTLLATTALGRSRRLSKVERRARRAQLREDEAA